VCKGRLLDFTWPLYLRNHHQEKMFMVDINLLIYKCELGTRGNAKKGKSQREMDR
jgi:hypothetical protein